MYISKAFNGIVEKKYLEMKEAKEAEAFLDEKNFGEMKVFINPEKKLTFSLVKFTMGDDTVYVGSN